MQLKTAPVGAAPVKAGPPPFSAKMDADLRWFGAFFFRPAFYLFSRTNASPNYITLLGTVFAIAAGIFLAYGEVVFAGVLWTFSGACDISDGYIAKTFDRTTQFGSFLDSLCDRLSDAAIFFGMGIHYLRHGEGIYFGLCMTILTMAFLISYARAKAEGVGVSGKSGLMSRAPRILLLLIAMYCNAFTPWVMRTIVWIMAIMLLQTLHTRIVEVHRVLSE